MKKSHKQNQTSSSTRRKFLGTATTASAAAALSFPMISTAQTVTQMRFQSTWPSKDIFHEYAQDFAKKVNDMTGGELKIEVLPAGAVVPAFGLLDAVSKGTLDGGHGVMGYNYGKQSAIALWTSVQCSAWMRTWCWHGINTAAVKNCWKNSIPPSAPTSLPS